MGDTNEDKDKERLIGLREASEMYGFSYGYLRQLAGRGRLEAVKIGNSWVTTPADVENFIRSRDKRGAYRDDIEV